MNIPFSKVSLLFTFILISSQFQSQILPADRSCNWQNAGLSIEPTINASIVNILSEGGDNTGALPNDIAFQNALNHPSLENGGTIFFPEGIYRFRATIEVYNRNGIIIKGEGSDKTFFKFYANEYQSSWQWDAIHFRGQLLSQEYSLSSNANVGSNIIMVSNTSDFSPGDYLKIFQEDYTGVDCLGGSSEQVIGSGDINNCEARHSIAHFSKVVGVTSNSLILDNPIRFPYQTNWFARVRKFEPFTGGGVESLSLEFIGLAIENFQPKSVYFQLGAESWIKNVDSYNTGFGHFVVASSTNIEIKNCAGHQDFFGSQGGGRGYGIVFEYGANYCLAENNVLYELRHPLVVQSGANANVFGYNFSKRETPLWADIVMHGNYPFLNLFEGNVGEVYRGDNSGHGVNGPFNTFFRNRATSGITEFSGSTFNQNYIGNEISGTFGINTNNNFVFANTVNGSSSEALNDVSYYRSNPLPFDQDCSWPQIGFPNDHQEYKTPAQLRYEHVVAVPFDIDNCALNYDFIVNQISAPGANDGSISVTNTSGTIGLYWNDFNQMNGSLSDLIPGCYSVFIWNDEGCYNTETFEISESEPGGISLDINVKLQGPYDSSTDMMEDNLKSLSSFPLSSPYWLTEDFLLGGDEVITNESILSMTGNNAIVDWIFIELRDGSNPTDVIQTKSALLQRDGDVVSSSDGVSPVTFIDQSAAYNSVHVAIKHRNHLGVRTSNAISVIGANLILMDFTSLAFDMHGGNDATIIIDGKRLLRSGDANGDGTVGAVDKNSLWRIQNAQPYSYLYSGADFNLDGVVNTTDKNTHWRVNNGVAENLE